MSELKRFAVIGKERDRNRGHHKKLEKLCASFNTSEEAEKYIADHNLWNAIIVDYNEKIESCRNSPWQKCNIKFGHLLSTPPVIQSIRSRRGIKPFNPEVNDIPECITVENKSNLLEEFSQI